MALAVVGDHLNVNILLAADHQQVVELLLLRETHTMVGWNLVVGSGLVLHFWWESGSCHLLRTISAT